MIVFGRLTAVSLCVCSPLLDSDTFAFLFQCAGAKFDPDMRAATNVRCPDCLRAIAVYEANGYKPEGYVFSNSKYNNYKISA